MVSSRCAVVALVAAFFASGVHAQAPDASPQLRGSSSAVPPGQMLFRIANDASFPVTLANCDVNVTLSAHEEDALAYASQASVADVSFFWVVPVGATFDCDSGCPDCFYVSFGLEESGGLVMRIGYMAEAEDSEDGDEMQGFDYEADGGSHNKAINSDAEQGKDSDAAITGMKLVVTEATDGTRQSSVCRKDSCSPDWERDHAVAWNSTVDLVIEGTKEIGDIDHQPSNMLLLRRGGFRGGFRGPRVGPRFGRRFGPRVVYRPPIWRRPVWQRPVYPVGYCVFCSVACPWRCR